MLEPLKLLVVTEDTYGVTTLLSDTLPFRTIDVSTVNTSSINNYGDDVVILMYDTLKSNDAIFNIENDYIHIVDYIIVIGDLDWNNTATKNNPCLSGVNIASKIRKALKNYTTSDAKVYSNKLVYIPTFFCSETLTLLFDVNNLDKYIQRVSAERGYYINNYMIDIAHNKEMRIISGSKNKLETSPQELYGRIFVEILFENYYDAIIKPKEYTADVHKIIQPDHNQLFKKHKLKFIKSNKNTNNLSKKMKQIYNINILDAIKKQIINGDRLTYINDGIRLLLSANTRDSLKACCEEFKLNIEKNNSGVNITGLGIHYADLYSKMVTSKEDYINFATSILYELICSNRVDTITKILEY